MNNDLNRSRSVIFRKMMNSSSICVINSCKKIYDRKDDKKLAMLMCILMLMTLFHSHSHIPITSPQQITVFIQTNQ